MSGLSLIGMSPNAHVLASIVALGMVGVAFGVLNTTMTTTLQLEVAPEILGQVGGALMAVSAIATPLGSIAAGWPVLNSRYLQCFLLRVSL